jgi:hypothetical protein
MSSKNSAIDKSIEYAVLLIVLVVVGVSVAYITGDSGPDFPGISDTTARVSDWTNSVSVTKTAVLPDGKLSLRLSNNLDEKIIITSLILNGEETGYIIELEPNSQKNFILNKKIDCYSSNAISGTLDVSYLDIEGNSIQEAYPLRIAFVCGEYVASFLENQCQVCDENQVCTGDANVSDIMSGVTCSTGEGEITGTYVPMDFHTGQVTSYDSGALDDAEQDGTAKSICYTDNDDNTISDSCTGLMWEKEDSGTTYSWENALTYCDTQTTGGHTDWRLPSTTEIVTFGDYSCTSVIDGCTSHRINEIFGASVNIGGFLDFSGYWSSTTNLDSNTSNEAYYFSGLMGAFYGASKGDSSNYGTRCVRSIQ